MSEGLGISRAGRRRDGLWRRRDVVAERARGLAVVPTSLPESQWLQPGRYSVYVSGFDFRADALTQICSPGGVPPAGKIVRTEIELIADGDWLIGHANAGDVNLEIRLRDAGATPGIGRGRAAVGEVRGWATDRGGDFGPATGVTFTTGTTDGAQSAAISGETFPGFGAPLSMLGSAEGHVVFSTPRTGRPYVRASCSIWVVAHREISARQSCLTSKCSRRAA